MPLLLLPLLLLPLPPSLLFLLLLLLLLRLLPCLQPLHLASTPAPPIGAASHERRSTS